MISLWISKGRWESAALWTDRNGVFFVVRLGGLSMDTELAVFDDYGAIGGEDRGG